MPSSKVDVLDLTHLLSRFENRARHRQGMDSSPMLRFVAQLRAEKAGTKTPKDRVRSPESKT